MKKRRGRGSIMAWGSPGSAAIKTAKFGKGADEATCFSWHEGVKELKKWDHF
ncbi:MAG: hypothetical protein NT087_14215 [Deltaproteobacteria bacterium]|nr:hypothetical protein [Deltaproteobacteria bacterium]